MKPEMRGARLYSSRGQFVCYLNDQKQLVKSALESKHMLQKPPAWAWDVDIIENGIDRGAVELVIYAEDTKNTYRSTVKNFMEHKGPEINRGHGRQWFLPLDRWRVNNRAPEGTQIDMFKE